MFWEGNDPKVDELMKDPVTAAVLHHFDTICSVPHGSGNEKELTGILKNIFSGEGRSVRVDAAGNLIADIPATPGHENAPLLVLQGHSDMVCAVRLGSDYDPETDPISARIAIDEQSGRAIIESCGDSSLGADCGLGDAAIMWLLGKGDATDEPVHGPVRVIMTTKEENGLGGAQELDRSVFADASFVINVDGFECGRFIAGSAGGRREKFTRPLEAVDTSVVMGNDLHGARTYELCIRGFQGGHSGSDIGAGRVNALWQMAKLLQNMKKHGVKFAISSFSGGDALNAIAADASTVLTVARKHQARFQHCIGETMQQICEEFGTTDCGGNIIYYETHIHQKSLSRESTDALIGFLSQLEIGVCSWMKDMPGIPETSCNLGVVEASPDHGEMKVHIFERSFGGDIHEALIEKHRKLASEHGFIRVYFQNYPAWKYREDSRLPALAAECFRSVSGMDGRIEAEHVGLEPAVFCGLDPSLDMVCMGADVLDPHSINERVHLDTVAPFAKTLRAVVEKIAEL